MWPFSKQKKLNKDEFREVLAILLEIKCLNKHQASQHNPTPEQMVEVLRTSEKIDSRLHRLTGKTYDELFSNNAKLLHAFLEPYKNTVEFREWQDKINKIKGPQKKLKEGEFKEVIAILHKIHDMDDDLKRCIREVERLQDSASIANLKKVKDELDPHLYRLSELTGTTAEDFLGNAQDFLAPYENTVEFQEWDKKVRLKNG